MECAKFNPKLREAGSSYGAKKIRFHSGLLVWLHNDLQEIEKNIKPELAGVRLDIETEDPVYIIDNARASFLLKVVDDLRKCSATAGEYFFFYPRIGTAVSVDSERKGKSLPLELIAADIIPAVLVQKDGRQELLLYADEPFDPNIYKRLVAYGLNFATGLVSTIRIGMTDFNPVKHKEETEQVRMAFHERTEDVVPFSFNRSILDLLQE
jgi:hypothetical protein